MVKLDKTWVYGCENESEAIDAAKRRLDPDYTVRSVIVYNNGDDHRVHLCNGDALDRFEKKIRTER